MRQCLSAHAGKLQGVFLVCESASLSLSLCVCAPASPVPPLRVLLQMQPLLCMSCFVCVCVGGGVFVGVVGVHEMAALCLLRVEVGETRGRGLQSVSRQYTHPHRDRGRHTHRTHLEE